MLDLLFAIVALVIGILAMALGVFVLTGVGLGALLGRSLERIAGRLVPGKPTGLGAEGLVGSTAVVVRDFGPAGDGGSSMGTVRVAGELWSARAAPGSAWHAGHRVCIVAVQGLELAVEELP